MNEIKNIIAESITLKQSLLQNDQLLETIQQVTKIVIECFSKGNRVWFCGNGGSAADAQHLAAEFSGRFYKDRKALPSEALHCNTSYITAVANDYGYQHVYERLIEGVGHKGDVLFGISTSGNSVNIVNAFKKAKEMGMTTVGMTGMNEGKMTSLSDYIINVPSDITPRIQEMHILVGHIICELTEKELFKD
mgnify:CR=1 FL=1